MTHRRTLLTGAIAGLLLSTAPRAQGRQGSVLSHGADPSGAADSTEAFRKAIAAFDVVRIPAGSYLVGDLSLRAGVTLVGEGERSVLVQAPKARFVLTADSGSPRIADNLAGMVIRDLQLRGHCDREGFSEQIHLVSLNGVSNTLIENVLFRGFRGDGLYLGSSHRAKTERHNLRTLVRRCRFDGINKENRNAISAIDSDGLLVEQCRFDNITRGNMPGAIDLEPNDNAFHVIRNIGVIGNTFANIGGNSGVVCMNIPVRHTSMPSDILIADNVIESTTSTAFTLLVNVDMPANAPSFNARIENNRVNGPHGRPFILRGIKGVSFERNRFTRAHGEAIVSHKIRTQDVRLIENIFDQCGWEFGSALNVYDVDGLEITKNDFIDCGNGSATASAIHLRGAAGRGRRISMDGNRFLAPGGRMKYAVQKESGYAVDRASFKNDNIVDRSLKNAM